MVVGTETINIFVLNGRALRFSFIKGKRDIVILKKLKKFKVIARIAVEQAALVQ